MSKYLQKRLILTLIEYSDCCLWMACKSAPGTLDYSNNNIYEMKIKGIKLRCTAYIIHFALISDWKFIYRCFDCQWQCVYMYKCRRWSVHFLECRFFFFFSSYFNVKEVDICSIQQFIASILCGGRGYEFNARLLAVDICLLFC